MRVFRCVAINRGVQFIENEVRHWEDKVVPERKIILKEVSNSSSGNFSSGEHFTVSGINSAGERSDSSIVSPIR